jgi:hypothetical protein
MLLPMADGRDIAPQQRLASRHAKLRRGRTEKLPANCLTQDISYDGFTLWKRLAQRRRSAHGVNPWHLVCQRRKHEWSHGLGGLAGLGSPK